MIGLAGTGDLVGTALAPQSRNRRAGELLAQGVPAAEIPERIGQAVEALDVVPLLAARARARRRRGAGHRRAAAADRRRAPARRVGRAGPRHRPAARALRPARSEPPRVGAGARLVQAPRGSQSAVLTGEDGLPGQQGVRDRPQRPDREHHRQPGDPAQQRLGALGVADDRDRQPQQADADRPRERGLAELAPLVARRARARPWAASTGAARRRSGGRTARRPSGSCSARRRRTRRCRRPRGRGRRSRWRRPRGRSWSRPAARGRPAGPSPSRTMPRVWRRSRYRAARPAARIAQKATSAAAIRTVIAGACDGLASAGASCAAGARPCAAAASGGAPAVGGSTGFAAWGPSSRHGFKRTRGHAAVGGAVAGLARERSLHDALEARAARTRPQCGQPHLLGNSQRPFRDGCTGAGEVDCHENHTRLQLPLPGDGRPLGRDRRRGARRHRHLRPR